VTSIGQIDETIPYAPVILAAHPERGRACGRSRYCGARVIVTLPDRAFFRVGVLAVHDDVSAVDHVS
jgi:hypothetical protein